ncbi:MAG TPA: cobalamin-dependent protein, partial [Tepidisphaeraceae bacterium]|nr:cobalamin-dependent protein [Tepidisphaeraceae bacterium]
MADIVLTTLNAKYAHAAFGLRYLLANLPPALRERAAILEFDVSQRPVDVLEVVLARRPKVVGVGVYIWNVDQATRLVADLKRVSPETTIVLGGPEVSHETEQQEIVRHADYVVTGEADLAFADLCEKLLAGRRPLQKVIPAEPPEFDRLGLPYDRYTEEDVAHRVIYVEASRGCPFRCEFCLSSLDVPVRNVPLDDFLAHMDRLLARGVRRFKFVDRTFNLNLHVGRSILQFFLDRYTPGLFLHFEMIPDRLPEALREPIRAFPPGALQFEVGIQTFNEEVSQRISRRQDNAKVQQNLRFLREET